MTTSRASGRVVEFDRRRSDAPVVCKFGGSSLAEIQHVRSVAERLVALQREGRKVVAILSAMGDSTDHLVELAHQLTQRPPSREFDALLSLGESLSCTVAALAVHALGGRAVSLTGWQAGVMTDGAHGRAQLGEVRPQRILDALDDGNIVFVTGFQGVSPNGDVTTLGRGGSDASAVVLAHALGADHCEIYTDVPGVFTADPRVVSDARRLVDLSHEEMLLLAAAGAKVVQPRAAELALAHGVDIHVRSTFAEGDGTWIRRRRGLLERRRMIGVAHRLGDHIFAIRDSSVAAVAGALAEHGITVGTIMRCDDEVRFTAPDAEPDDVTTAVRAAGSDLLEGDELGGVSIVGIGIGTHPEICSHGLGVLERMDVEPQLVKTASGQVTFVVPAGMVPDAARAFHDAFGLRQELTVEEVLEHEAQSAPVATRKTASNRT
ncbi:MAG: aspartate kinase [Thermoleophilaceae bacterium]|jgi:aspartate kinase|nr:aspartate kinase [Thermoleophilaceae bacterium]